MMSKVLIGYVLDEHIGMPLRRNTNYKFKLYGFTVFDTELRDEIVIKYSAIDTVDIFGLAHGVKAGYTYAEFFVFEGVSFEIRLYDFEDIQFKYTVINLPIFDIDMICLNSSDSNYIIYNELIFNCSGFILHHLVYDRVNKLIDLCFDGFSMIFSDFKYWDYSGTYSNFANTKIELEWFSDYSLLDLDGVYKYHNICVAYKPAKNVVLPRECKVLCSDFYLSTNDSAVEYAFTNLVINPELEFICTRNKSSLHSLCFSKT